MDSERDAEGRQRWLCQKCAHVVSDLCGSIRLPLGTDILHNGGTTGHAAIQLPWHNGPDRPSADRETASRLSTATPSGELPARTTRRMNSGGHSSC